VSARLAQLGILPNPGKAGRNYDDEHGKPVMPTVPEGWQYVSSSEGVGVLAPATQFDPALPRLMMDPSIESSILEVASRYAPDHFPATALWLLRESYWRTWAPARDHPIALCGAMIDAYRSLGRPSLAQAVERRLAIVR
jgi:hypothetical protein